MGPARTHLNLPKGLVCHHSPFFDKAFNGQLPRKDKGKHRSQGGQCSCVHSSAAIFMDTMEYPRKPLANEAFLCEDTAQTGSDGPSSGSDIEIDISRGADRAKRPYRGIWVHVKLYVLADLGKTTSQTMQLMYCALGPCTTFFRGQSSGFIRILHHRPHREDVPPV